MQETAYMAHCRALVLGIIALLSLPILALTSYQAEYDLSIRGVPAGTIRHDAIFTNITYRIDTVAEPSLAAKMLGYGQIRETVIGLLQNNHVQPEKYQRDMVGNPKYHLHYQFIPNEHQVDIEAGENQKVVDYQKNLIPLDTLSMVVQSLIDISNNHIPQYYTLVMEDNIQSYQVQQLPDQTWKTRKGDNFTVHVYRQVNGDKQTLVYYADNPLRLVRLEQLRKGKKRFSMTLIEYKLLK